MRPKTDAYYTTVTSMDLRNGMADVLSRVRHAGERVIITRSGKPVAAIIPIEELRALATLEDKFDIEAADEARQEDVFYDLEEVLRELAGD